MSKPEPFNKFLELDIPIKDLWPTASEFSPIGERKDKRYTKRYGGLLLREIVANGLNNVDVPLTPSSLSDSYLHFSKLQHFGMTIVSFTTELSSDTNSTSEDPYGFRVIGYSASSYITRLRSLRSKSAILVPKARVIKSITDPLRRYNEWCEEAETELVLSDIYHTDQYSQIGLDRLLLHDISPDMQKRSNQSGIEETLKEFESMFI